MQDKLIIANKEYNSRLLVGSGKYQDIDETYNTTVASGAEIITVAIRRTNIGQNQNEPNLLSKIDPNKWTILPNTAGCYTADDAIRTCRLARELLGGKHNLVKLEVLGDTTTLYPNIVETITAAKVLVDDGFEVMVYTNDDPIVAKTLEDIGCVAIMPLGSLIGSGRGIDNPRNIQIIQNNAKVPVLVDAGIGCASDATLAMELGVDAVLINSAIAQANNPIMMAEAMKNAVIAGRQSYLAGRMEKKLYASASSPLSNLI
jgi:thiazole synthase